MAVPSRHFFDLSAASLLSRSLRQGRPAPDGTHSAPAAVGPPSPEATPPAGRPPSLAPFESSAVQYAEELWQAILSWIQEGLGAAGVFALDRNGFSIASVGEATSVPFEVLMAAFTSVAQLLEAYLQRDRRLEELVISTKNETPVTMLALPWDEDVILFGIHDGRRASAEELEMIRTTVRRELFQFGSSEQGGVGTPTDD